MADEIIQTLGFDAGQALKELDKLDQKLGTIQQSFQQLSGTIGQFNQLNAGKSVASLGSSSATAAKQVEQTAKATERLTVSWGLLTRVVATQLIVSAFGDLRREIAGATRDAVEFQKQIGQIATLSPGVSFDSIGKSVRSLSDDLNFTLEDAGAALEQTISNQIGKTLQQSEAFARSAGRFAKATGSSFADSVDLLSGAVKSFGLSELEADRVAGIFFTTIDKGRISADQLANKFGELGPIAHQTGLSLEETTAALAAVTLPGTNTAQAMTAVRGIMAGLIKPSDKMAEILKTWGFNSGEAAIRALTFEGVLRKLSTEAGGSTTALAAMFPNLRGLQGTLSLTSDDLVTVADNMRAMKAAGADLANQKFFEAINNDGERVTATLNKLRNEAVVSLGQGLLKVADSGIKMLGGADTIIGAIRDHVDSAVGAVERLEKAMSSDKGVVGKAADITGALGQGALGALGVGGILNTVDRKQFERDVAAPVKAIREANQQEADAKKKALADQLQTQRQAEAAQLQSLQKAVQARLAEHEKEAKRIAELQKQFPNDTGFTQRLKDQAAANFARGLPAGFTPDNAEGKIGQLQQKQNADLNKAAEQRANQIDLSKLKEDATDILGLLDTFEGSFDKASPAGQVFEGIREKIEALSTSATTSKADIEAVLAEFTKFNDVIQQDPVAKSGFGDSIGTLAQALGSLNDKVNLESALKLGTDEARRLTEQLGAAATKAASIQIPSAAAQAKAMGGILHFASGGLARGSDQIPALLSAGETVIDARNSRRFFPQIQAMRAGVPPVFRQGGGTVNNTSIGDISINVPGTKVGAREIMAEMRRELRKRTSIL